MNNEETKPFCKRCLLSETDETELLKSVTELINAMPENKKADSETYIERLSVCMECSGLYRGMCRECGCYVELRAVKSAMRCPAVPPKW